MGSVRSKVIFNEANVAATADSDIIEIPSHYLDFILWLKAFDNGGTVPTLDVVLYHAPENGLTFPDEWEVLATFAQVTTTVTYWSVESIPLVHGSDFVHRYLKARATLTGAALDYDFVLKALCRHS